MKNLLFTLSFFFLSASGLFAAVTDSIHTTHAVNFCGPDSIVVSSDYVYDDPSLIRFTWFVNGDTLYAGRDSAMAAAFTIPANRLRRGANDVRFSVYYITWVPYYDFIIENSNYLTIQIDTNYAGDIGTHTMICLDSFLELTGPQPHYEGTWFNTNPFDTLFLTGIHYMSLKAGHVLPADTQDTLIYTVANTCGIAESRLPLTIKDCSTLSVAHALAPVADVFPNPTNGKVTFPADVTSVEVYSISGKKVAETTPRARNVLDLGTQPPGIYYLKLISGGNIRMQKLIKE